MIPLPEADPGQRIVSLHDVKFTYDGGVEALRGVNLHIRNGEFVAIVGGNGSGKTTLAKHMNGLLRPTSGEVMVSGKPAAGLSVADLSRVVGYAFQNPDHQLFCTTVEAEVSYGPRNLGYHGPELSRRVEYAIEAMGLGGFSELPPLSLNLGQRRRVSIAAVISMDPRVLILDEPTTGLDAGEIRVLMESIGELNRKGRAIILITHEMKVVAEHANRVVVMADGRTVLDSDARGVFADLEVLAKARLVPPPISLLAHRLASSGISRDIMTPEEFVFDMMRARGGP